MANDHFRFDTAFMEIMSEREPQRLHADEVDFLRIQPARVIFAKTGFRDQRFAFERERIGRQPGFWNSEHAVQS